MAWLIACVALFVGCGGDTEDPAAEDHDQPAYVTESQIAFVSNRDGYRRIYVMNTDGTNQRAISDPPYGGDNSPAWSPDATQIAFVYDGEGNDEIYVMDADGGSRHNISNSPDTRDSNPAWSPDGASIAFTSDREGRGVFVMDASGADARRIYHEGGRPSWAPDGGRLAFVASSSGHSNVSVWNVAGGQPRVVARTPDRNAWTAWSPDGEWIATTTDKHEPRIPYDEWQSIMVMDTAGANARTITNNPRGPDLAPTWSPDGRSIAYAAVDDSWLGGRSDIHVVNVADLSVRSLTNSRDFDSMPAWSP
ncbi:hypothetical protein HN371_22025 [Candidatus Poribacteria bacterium]|nr:hypothetical protein [Candidatus Poribacteria bacterium]MBT5534981.1 hypothetical protein [Candidatus Poribacteria bacterium]MBT5710301.1 hypothetical protein [Candidatus Poribacteria bacterium]MBT7097588.1 hypothetical protein [Candidatus Poribacteria bacterium]MBT7804807.1 hypothetical protein [Candidatus Poribacteria bacterium]